MNHTTAPKPTEVLPILRPFQRFFQTEASGGILLLIFTVIALVWANSPWSAAYESLWQTPITIGGGALSLSKPLILWINDGLMALFFFLVGLEIKREILAGELASPRRAALPIIAALGGLLMPALIYTLFNAGQESAMGWGVPIATDIAFALGIMALLGDRVPTSLKIFLTALAIVDDLSAVLVIALFYTAEITWVSLFIGVVVLGLLFTLSRLGFHNTPIYAILGIIVWVAFLKSGIHATIAGVLLALTVPARTHLDPAGFVHSSRKLLDRFEHAGDNGESVLVNETRQVALHALEAAAGQVQAPLQRLEHNLAPWVSFFIMPVFALANAGVALTGDIGATLSQSTTLGVIIGLVIGKPLGIMLFSWLAVRFNLADKPADVTWRHLHAVGWLAGVGFTMSLFIAGLAFDGTALLPLAKTGILVASLLAGVIGFALLRRESGR
ncbi:MAG: Na+/H+ antiporter NhaA [Anaerolineaceae bacterium]|nr:Na+/H+ antiporter NhaA [Anaerolineaceae bacterium]